MTRALTTDLDAQVRALEAELAGLSSSVSEAWVHYPIGQLNLSPIAASELLLLGGVSLRPDSVVTLPHRSPRGVSMVLLVNFQPEGYQPPAEWVLTGSNVLGSDQMWWSHAGVNAAYRERCADRTQPVDGSGRRAAA